MRRGRGGSSRVEAVAFIALNELNRVLPKEGVREGFGHDAPVHVAPDRQAAREQKRRHQVDDAHGGGAVRDLLKELLDGCL